MEYSSASEWDEEEVHHLLSPDTRNSTALLPLAYTVWRDRVQKGMTKEEYLRLCAMDLRNSFPLF